MPLDAALEQLLHELAVDQSFVRPTDTDLSGARRAHEEDARRFHHLKLEFDRVIAFPSALTIRHFIDETSPLFGVTPELLQQASTRFMTSIVCIDTVIQAPVQSETSYLWSDVRFDHQFVEIYTEHDEGRFEVDYGRIHETEPVPHPPAA